MTHSLALFAIATMLTSWSARAQQSGEATDATQGYRRSIGVYATGGVNLLTASVTGLPGIPSCCPTYSTGTGLGLAVGGLYDVVFSPSVSLLARAGVSTAGGTLRATENILVNPDGGAVPGTVIHTLATTRLFATIEPLIKMRLAGELSGMVGPVLGVGVSTSFDQVERLDQPSDVTFENGQRTRFAFSGTIPEASTMIAGAVVGVRYELPMTSDRSMSLIPEITYTHYLSSLQSNQTWNLGAIRAGLAIQWNTLPEPPPPTPEPPPPTPEPPPAPKPAVVLPVLAVSGISVDLLDNNGGKVAENVITVTNTVSTNLYALLHYVFFDDSSSTIPQRYRQLSRAEADAFDLKVLNGSGTLPIYYQMLNIVGLKLRQTPSAMITLVGCNSNTGPEKGNTSLSRARAESLKKYFVDVWGIAPSRLTVKERNLPEVPSNSTTPDGIEENRRVEFLSSDLTILEPLFFTDTMRTSSAPIVRFRQNIRSESGLSRWAVVASQGGTALKTFSGDGSDGTSTLDWDLGADIATFPTSDQPISYSIRVTDNNGRTRDTIGRQIDVKQIVRKDKRIEKFTLIIFGFNEAEFTDPHERIITIIRQRIAANSTVTVEGHTDRSGEADYNLKLSQRRASATATRLKIPADRATGFGSKSLLYDNSTPEGRLYCRTVLITVETPIE